MTNILNVLEKLFTKKTGEDKKNPDKQSRYNIYIYGCPSNNRHNTHWRKVGATNNISDAITQAKILHKKQEYERVEIQKHAYSKEHGHYIPCTFKTFEKKRPSIWENFKRSMSISS
ncbi:MAG: hypothetical protein ACLFP8_06210 [Alphaproteobacteria bacterium]